MGDISGSGANTNEKTGWTRSTEEDENRSGEWVHVEPSQPLKVVIVGGGIGGLTTAIALRQQGHVVQIYESSGFSKEIGAALNVTPNANGVLKRLGISCKDIGACVAEWMSEWTYTGTRVKKIDLLAHHKIFQHRFRLAHRIKLHEALRKAATEEKGPGLPAELHLSMPVKEVDAVNGVVHFQDGTSVQGDVVIGADGVHSSTRASLPDGKIQPSPSGQSAIRFLVSRESILSDPATRKFVEDNGNFNGLFGPDRSIITYPTNNNTLINFVCIHPELASVSTESWGSSTTVAKLLEVYKDFHEDILAVIGKADESSLKVWKLLDMEPVPKWCHGRLAVMGDAAHPFMPFLGQGAAMAIEDAVTLGIVLERGLDREDVPDRLKLYQAIRKERAELVQHYTRLSGKSRGEKSSFDAARYQLYCFKHDEWDYSTQKLREWKWKRLPQSEYQMADVFGPTRRLQPSCNVPSSRAAGATYTSALIKFHTSRTVLDGLLPPGNASFRFKSPGSIAQCTFRQTSFKGLPSLGGRGYSHLSFYIHGVEYTDENKKTADGAFVPVAFENVADMIVQGREQRGAPKIWSTIDVERDRRSYHVRAGWEGLTWGNFYLDGLEPVLSCDPVVESDGLPDASAGDKGVLIHQYVPRINDDADPSLQQAEVTRFVPNEGQDTTVQRVWRAKSAHFKLNARDEEAFPTLHHIIARLEEIPVLGMIEAKVVEGSGIPDLV